MGTERGNAVALGRMMARGDEGNAAFSREMHGLLGNLAADEDIDAEAHRLLEVALRGARAPRHPAYRTVPLRL